MLHEGRGHHPRVHAGVEQADGSGPGGECQHRAMMCDKKKKKKANPKPIKLFLAAIARQIALLQDLFSLPVF